MPTSPTVAPYGSWRSPVTAEWVAEGGVSLSSPLLVGEDLYWLEGRPLEGGRSVLVHRSVRGGELRDLTPEGYNVRSRVHEYGGGAYMVDGPWVVFANFADQRLYRQPVAETGSPEPITGVPPFDAAWRFADLTIAGSRVVCVRERHDLDPASSNAPGAVVNEIVALALDGSAEPSVLASGNDFYANPRVSSDGGRLAWTTWNHPNMPWDGCELWVGELDDDAVTGARLVAGGTDESIVQPLWGPDGSLHFVSDRSGWWNPYREIEGRLERLATVDAEFGFPQWVFGMSRAAFLDDGSRVTVMTAQGREVLTVHGPGANRELPCPFTSFGDSLVGAGRRVTFVGGAPTRAPSLVVLEVDSGAFEVVRPSLKEEPDPGLVSEPETITCATGKDALTHALFYPPRNPAFRGLEGERPPLVVVSHGGPTGNTSADLRLGIQFWTSRGFAVADVDYRGSTGYGRAYRNALRGGWGVADVEDCIAVARTLAERGRVDPSRLAIRGGSAGGYTTLCALTFHDEFAVGASYYGVSDPAALARDTHKFESRYLDRLIGPYPQAAAVYEARSPLHHVERLSTPLILFQGLEDTVVPPSQSQEIAEALERRGVLHAYLSFPGEQHGFRRAETIRSAFDAELWFYGRVLGFAPADPVEPPEVGGR